MRRLSLLCVVGPEGVRVRLLCVVCFAAAVALAPCLCAGAHAKRQPPRPEHGTVRGRIRDARGATIPASIIVIEGRGRRPEVGYTEDGEFRIDLPAGVYHFTVRSDGFRTISRRRVRVRAGRTATLDFTLDRTGPGGRGRPAGRGTFRWRR